jgi:hypothetical protein
VYRNHRWLVQESYETDRHTERVKLLLRQVVRVVTTRHERVKYGTTKFRTARNFDMWFLTKTEENTKGIARNTHVALRTAAIIDVLLWQVTQNTVRRLFIISQLPVNTILSTADVARGQTSDVTRHSILVLAEIVHKSIYVSEIQVSVILFLASFSDDKEKFKGKQLLWVLQKTAYNTFQSTLSLYLIQIIYYLPKFGVFSAANTGSFTRIRFNHFRFTFP